MIKEGGPKSIPIINEKIVFIPISKDIILESNLSIPENAKTLVIFVHGSGSSRLSPRNKHVAYELNKIGLATLLFDLLTKDEEMIDNINAQLRFDIPFLAQRLEKVTEWVKYQNNLAAMKLGYFGASTGAAAALICATKFPDTVKAVVSRGGRPDLVDSKILEQVTAATLLIVGGKDIPVIEVNEIAFSHLKSIKKIEIIPGASHLFEEAGKLDLAAEFAGEWFKKYLV